MLLFLISFVLVFAASFFLTAVLENEKFIISFIYILIFSFANIVLTMEVLSLFSAISQTGVLTLNLLFAAASLVLWLNRGKPLFEFSFKQFFKRLYAAIKSDKYLLLMLAGVIFMLVVSLGLILISPVVNPDAQAYHVLRSLLWIMDKHISHPPVSDVRNLVMPVNSELVYSWIILFLKKDILLGAVSFCGYLLSVSSLWGILSYIGAGFRRKLWVVTLLSSFAFVIVQLSSTETDIIIAGLILSSIYLFIQGLVCDKKSYVVMSALAYALAVGTKTPAVIMIPAVGLWMSGLSVYIKKKEFYKPLLLFCCSFIVLFFIFGSYNYILNYIDFGNIAGSKSFLIAHQNNGGLKDACANFIKYIFMFFDFTGFAFGNLFERFVLPLRDSILLFFNLEGAAEGVNSTTASNLNNTLLEPLVGLGVLGLLVYLPSLVIALVRPIFTRKKRDIFIMSFVLMFLIGLAVLSYSIVFMTFSVRFVASFCVISAPVLVYSYFKKNNILKFLMVFFALFYLLFLSTHIWARPALTFFRYFKHGTTVADIREIGICSQYNNHIARRPDALKNSPVMNEACIVRNELKKYNKKNKILYFSNTTDELFLIALLNLNGYNIDFNLIENVENIDFSKYNLILTPDDTQKSTNILHFEDIQNGRYDSSGISCEYIDIKSQKILSPGREYPYMSLCSMNSYFYRTNNFKPDRTFILEKFQRKKTDDIYKFYENQGNPVIR